MALQSSQRLPELLFYTKKSYRILQAPIPAPIPAPMLHVHTTLQSREFSIQNPILHTEDKELFEYYTPDSRNSTHRRQGDLLEMHPCVLHDIPGNSSCSRDIPDIPVIHDLPAFQAILQCSSISRESTPFQHFRMHILHILHILQVLQFDWFPQKTPPSTSWAITDITNITFFKEREMLRYRSRCQDDIFPRIELIPSFVLSSDNTNCKNDIQLFHQLFDELSVHTDYH